MLAQPGPSAPTRLERARDVAKQIRAGLPDVPVGVSSLTDRLLPHLFPTMSATAFTSTIDRSIEIERPPPERRATARDRVRGARRPRPAELLRQTTRNRVAFVLTDGESIPFNLGELRDPLVAGRVTLHFVHLWDQEERVYDARRRQESYRPSPASRSVLDRVAREIGGGVHSEQEVGGRDRRPPRARLGSGPVAPRAAASSRRSRSPRTRLLRLCYRSALVLLRRNF